MSFIPGDLHLLTNENGEHVVTLAGSEVMRTRSQKKATERFKELRSEMEKKYPTCELTSEERAAMLQAAIAEAIIGTTTVRKRKKSTARGTRTFGG